MILRLFGLLAAVLLAIPAQANGGWEGWTFGGAQGGMDASTYSAGASSAGGAYHGEGYASNYGGAEAGGYVGANLYGGEIELYSGHTNTSEAWGTGYAEGVSAGEATGGFGFENYTYPFWD